jgi:transglutaminase-like putative cysteine protease
MSPREPLPDRLPGSAWEALAAGPVSDEQADALQCSGFARATPRLDAFAAEIGLERSSDPLTVLRGLTSELCARFQYMPSATRVDSPIDDALRVRAGVCQDFAHVMIALVRRLRIPCRYVSGYLSPNPDAPDRSLAGVTHAWVEAWLPGLGWVGFDPTNDALAGPRHIVVAVGRDYSDVPPTRGVFRGEALSELSVAVAVALANQPLGPDEPAAMATWRSSDALAGAAADDDYAQQQ